MSDGQKVINEHLLEIRDVTVEYNVQGQRFTAISDINLSIEKGETLGLVGESGCGKSTMGTAIIQLPSPTSGSVKFAGQELTDMSHAEMRPIRKRLQIIFQDPISSLNPRRRVRNIVAEPLAISGVRKKDEIDYKVREALSAVGMDPDITMDRRPHQFSGGQCQRICIARALILEPDLIVCDEPVSSLDVSVQAHILNLMRDLQQEHGLTLLFISHNLAVIDHMADVHPDDAEGCGILMDLARYQRVYVKISHTWSISGQEYPWRDTHEQVQEVYQSFGPQRVMWGTDWPVCLPRAEYRQTLSAVRDEMSFIAPEDLEWILGKTVQRLWPFA